MADKIALDTNVFLNVINGDEPFSGASAELLDLIDSGHVRGVVSVVCVAELSVGYNQSGDAEGLRDFVAHVAASPNYELAILDIDSAVLAGKIRADTGLRLPDSIIVASGIKAGTDYIVSGDNEFEKADRFLKACTPDEFLQLRAKHGGRDRQFSN